MSEKPEEKLEVIHDEITKLMEKYNKLAESVKFESRLGVVIGTYYSEDDEPPEDADIENFSYSIDSSVDWFPSSIC